MSEAGFTVDYREWQKAILEYSVATGKSNAEAVNRQANNLCIQAQKRAVKATAGAVKSTTQEEPLRWWHAHRIRQANPGMSRKDAYIKAKKSLAKRSRAVGFIKGWFAAMSRIIRTSSGQTVPQKKSFAGIVPHYQAATPRNSKAVISATYSYRRGGAVAQRAEAILQRALQAGINATVADMRRYVERELTKLGRKYSGR